MVWKWLNRQHFWGWNFHKFFRKSAIFAGGWMRNFAQIVVTLEALEQNTWLESTDAMAMIFHCKEAWYGQ